MVAHAWGLYWYSIFCIINYPPDSRVVYPMTDDVMEDHGIANKIRSGHRKMFLKLSSSKFDVLFVSGRIGYLIDLEKTECMIPYRSSSSHKLVNYTQAASPLASNAQLSSF